MIYKYNFFAIDLALRIQFQKEKEFFEETMYFCQICS